MLSFIRHHAILAIAFAIALGLTLLFLARFTLATVYWNDPAHRDQPIAGWMTPRYVVQAWRVPPELVARALDLDPAVARRLTLADLAQAQGRDLPDVIADVEAAIAQSRAAR